MLGLTQGFGRLIRRDRGAAMAAVVGLMAVSVVLTTVVASSVISATAVTTSVRAGVQSQAAAEAGIATARLGLVNGTCTARTGRYASAAGATPEFLATIWIPSGSGWTRGCPTGTATQVRILSSGYAAADGVDGVSGRDQTNIEVVLSALAQPTAAPSPTPSPTTTTPATPPVTLVASGPAIYAYNSSGFGGSGKLVSLDGSTPSVLVKSGDVACSGGSSGQADWIVDSGALAVSGSCNITGSVWVQKGLTVSGGTAIGGSAIASSITVTGSSKINGSAWATGNVVLDGGGSEVGVNVTAGGNLTITGSAKVKKNTWVQGHTSLDWGTNIGGNATSKTLSTPAYSSGLVSGTVTQTTPNAPGASPYAQPARPVVPDWIDFSYTKTDWVGFTEVVLTGTCDYAKLSAAVTTLAGKKGVLDARGCTNAIEVSSYQKLTLTNDLAIIANKFNLGGSGGFAAAADRRLWLIVPDTTANKLPTCAANQSFSMGGGFTFDSKIDVMIYSPCHVNVTSSTVMTGQVFAGEATVDGGSTLNFTAVGLPGWNLTTGVSTTTPVAPSNPNPNPSSTPTPAPTVTYTESDRTVVSSRIVTESN